MIFNFLSFLVFSGIVLALHNWCVPWTIKKFKLLVASYIFYVAWKPPFVILLWISTVINWWAWFCFAGLWSPFCKNKGDSLSYSRPHLDQTSPRSTIGRWS
ncbi:MAG: hypothetical protein NVS3B5_08120 [Sphingomicrobium sp.]